MKSGLFYDRLPATLNPNHPTRIVRCAVLIVGLISSRSSAQSAATVKLEQQTVQAGKNPVAVTFELDRGPSYAGGLFLYFDPAPGTPSGPGFGDSVALAPGQTTGTWTHSLAIDFPGGKYVLSSVTFGISTRKALQFQPVTVDVIPTEGLIAPTSARVSLTPTQNQFLLTKTSELNAVVADLTTSLSAASSDTPALKSEVRASLSKAAGLLARTEGEYRKLFASVDPDPVFFEDLANQYHTAITDLTPTTPPRTGSAPLGSPVRLQLKPRKGPAKRPPTDFMGSLPLYVRGALALMNANIQFYSIMLSTGKDEFLVDLRSSPSDASIEYRRVTQPFAPFSEHTDRTDVPLKLAFWYIRFSKNGCSQTLEANPINEPHPKLFAELKCQRR